MEIVHEFEKEILQGALLNIVGIAVNHLNVLGISLLWLESQGTNPKNIGNVQEIIQESTPFDCLLN